VCISVWSVGSIWWVLSRVGSSIDIYFCGGGVGCGGRCRWCMFYSVCVVRVSVVFDVSVVMIWVVCVVLMGVCFIRSIGRG